MIAVMRECNWPSQRERAKVQSDDYLVLEIPPPGAPIDSQGAKKAKIKRERHQAVWDEVHSTMEFLDPTFEYTGVALSKGFRGSPHIDAQDISYQWAMSFGEFTGGELCVESAPGEVSVVTTKSRAAKLDGRFPHWVAPWRGERYSAIVFKTRGTPTTKARAVYDLDPY